MSRILLALLTVWLLYTPARGSIERYSFSSEQQEQTYRQLTEQLRCPQCQNNSIADSNAPIATDMRLKVYQLVEQGYSQQQVVADMVARYGYFVSYDPPLTPATLLLWLIAPLFLLLAGVILFRHTRR